jgi:hypothetical protein
MHSWTIRAAILGVLSAAALIGASVGAPAGAAPASDGFAGPLAPGAVAQPIYRETATATGGTLHRVPCAAASAARTCFAAGR